MKLQNNFMEQEIENLKSENADLVETNKEQENQIIDLEKEIETLKAGIKDTMYNLRNLI